MEGDLDISIAVDANAPISQPLEQEPGTPDSSPSVEPPTAGGTEESSNSSGTLQVEPADEIGNPSLVVELHQRQLLENIVDLTHPRSSIQVPVATEKYTFKSTVSKSRDSTVEIFRDNDLQRDVRRVSLLPTGLSKKKTLRQFVHRAQILGQLSHPNLLPVYDFRVDETGKLSYQTPIVGGSTLEEALAGLKGNNQFAKQIYTPDKLMRCFLQAAQAVAHAHHHGIFHHALHPGHLRMASFGEVYLEGWDHPVIKALPRTHVPASSRRLGQQPGLSKQSEDQNLTYMAPEQVKDSPNPCDERTDVYSLGAILYALLTHTAPFSGDQHTVVGSIANGICEPIEKIATEHQLSVNPAYIQVCTKAMKVEPSERYQTVPELVSALEQAISGQQDKAANRASPTAFPAQGTLNLPPAVLKKALGVFSIVIAILLAVAIGIFGPSSSNDLESLIAKGETALQKGSEMYRGGKPLNDFIQQSDREFETTRRHLLDAVSHFQNVIQKEPDRIEIRMKLIESYFGLWRIAERSGNTADKKFLSEQIRIHQPASDTKRNPYLSFIEASFDIDVRSSPEGADVYLYRYSEDEDGHSIPVPVQSARDTKPIAFEQEWLSQWNQNKKTNRNPSPSSDAFFSQEARFHFGKTPASLKQLPVGSYVILVKKEGYQPQRYPFLLSRKNQIGELSVSLQANAAPDSHLKNATYVPAFPSRWLKPQDLPRSASANTAGFFMSTAEVSLELYSQFLEDLCRKGKWEVAFRRMPRSPKQKYFRLSSGCTIQPVKELRADWKTLPVTGVTYHDANASLTWYSAQTGENMRLPSPKEWNHAACGQDGRNYTWGNAPINDQGQGPDAASSGATFPVFGALAADMSPYGIAGLSSGAAEWIMSSEMTPQDKQRPFNPKTDLKKPQSIGGVTPASPTGHACQSKNKVSGNTISDDIGFRYVFYPQSK